MALFKRKKNNKKSSNSVIQESDLANFKKEDKPAKKISKGKKIGLIAGGTLLTIPTVLVSVNAM